MTTPSDLDARREALDIRRSFIVQAPAGSGKTELLTQRILALLACAETPEEIVAITFTRKAAAEMKNRLLERLEAADAVQRGLREAPEKDHELATHRLACGALGRDAELGWNLLTHPSRLRIQTIDGLCSSLVARMPVLAQLGGGIKPADDPGRHYLEAARETLADLETAASDSPDVAALSEVLAHMDNDLGKLEALIARMLGRREQWLPHLLDLDGDDREVRRWLEDLLALQSSRQLAAVRAALPPGFLPLLMPLARGAAGRLLAEGSDSPITTLADWEEFLTGEAEELPRWLAVCELCLTNSDSLRKVLNKNTGFPPAAKDDKAACMALLDSLDGEAEAALGGLRKLPPPEYSVEQWQVLRALMRVLRLAAARLWLQFMGAGEVDFAEIQSRALQALGTEEAPTDLALALDYRIRHLLVDEFQDTSGTQWELLTRLTAGWQAGDGRSLFLVGDPMQSIYLFRQAEVGLFLRAREEGLGGMPLVPLTLKSNFRSQEGIVAWVNQAFARIFPQKADVLRGAVPVSLAESVKPALPGPAVRMHAFLQALSYDPATLAVLEAGGGVDGRQAEARRVLDLVREALAEQASVAILVRSRSHLALIAPALRDGGVPFQAVDIDALADRQYIADLVSLTRALLLPGDRVHWLTVLRSPWCGLTLADLHALCGDDFETGMARLLADEERLSRLTPDGAARARRCRDVLAALMEQQGRLSLRTLAERAWLQLGGEALLPDAAARTDVEAYFDLVEEMEGQDGFEPDALADKLAALFAAPQVGDAAKVQLMTIHKSKGLEFDTVILPCLDRKPRNGDTELLQWMPTPAADGSPGLLIAPVHATGADRDALYQYIGSLREQKQAFEVQRLLYVAATRAKRQLHLTAAAGLASKGGEKSPKAHPKSLLALLWGEVAEEFTSLPLPADAEAPVAATPPARPLERVRPGWRPAAATPLGLVTAQAAAPALTEPAAVHLEAAAAGIATHRLLQSMAEEGVEKWNAGRVRALAPFLRRLVEREGVFGEAAERAARRAGDAVLRCLADEKGRWVLGAHPVARNEWALTEAGSEGMSLHVIDRYFETAEGERWVVDYKTDSPPDGDTEAFLAGRVEAHRPQLERYARLLGELAPGPVRLALYFASLPRLVELA